MALRLIATTCTDGDCPKLYVDDSTGDVVLQGYLTSGAPTPDGEALMRIPAGDWRTLLGQLDR